MAPAPPSHPKLSWKAFRRDLLRSLLATLGIVLGLGSLCFGFQLMHALGHRDVRRDSARLDLANIQHALSRYHAETLRYATTEEGLQALVEHQLLERAPVDPWGFPYRYALQEGRPTVWSLGADGLPGGEGEDSDVFDRRIGR